MRKYHLQADGIPEYINMLEDSQHTALHIDKTNPIMDTSVLNIGTAAMLSSQQFPRTTEEWEDAPPVDKHWKNGKQCTKQRRGSSACKQRLEAEIIRSEA